MINYRCDKKQIIQIILTTTTLLLGIPASLKAQPKNISFNEFLNNEIAILNQKLPIMIDQNLRWDSSSIIAGEAVVYEYTLVNSLSSDIPQTFSQAVNLMVKETMCGEHGLHEVYKNGMSFKANYYSKDDYLVGEVTVTPSDCGY